MQKGFYAILCLALFCCKAQSSQDEALMETIDPNAAYELSKDISVPPDKVYNALLDPVILKDLWRVSSITVDPRPEGKAMAKLQINGENRDFTLTYKELIRNEKLRWVIHFDSLPGTEIYTTLWLKKKDDRTHLTLRQENFASPAERDEFRKEWEFALIRLEAFISWE